MNCVIRCMSGDRYTEGRMSDGNNRMDKDMGGCLLRGQVDRWVCEYVSVFWMSRAGGVKRENTLVV